MTPRTAQVDVGAWVMRAVLMLLGAAVLVGGIGYGLQTPEGLVGAGLVPAAAGFVMVVALGADSLKALRAQRQPVSAEVTEPITDDVEPGAEEDADGEGQRLGTGAVLRVFAVIFGTTLLAYVLGLLLALTLMVAVLLRYVERQSWRVAVLGAVLAFAFGYLVFGVALNVPLPTGMLGLV